MKKVSIGMLCLMCIGIMYLPGCDSEPTPQQMQKYGSGLESITDQIKIYQQLISSYTALLQETGAIDANDVAKVNILIAQADKVTPELQKVANALKEGHYSDTQGLITVLEGMKAANLATSSFNKYWPAIDAILVIAVALLTWLAKKKAAEVVTVTAEKDLATSTLKNVVTGVQVSSDTAYDEVTSNIHNDVDQKALVTSLKPDVPEGFEIYKTSTVVKPS